MGDVLLVQVANAAHNLLVFIARLRLGECTSRLHIVQQVAIFTILFVGNNVRVLTSTAMT